MSSSGSSISSSQSIDSAGSTVEYDDSINIEVSGVCFNLLENSDKPDLRNVKYKTATEHLNCPVCQQPFIEPLTTICGHTFCKECIYECFKNAKKPRDSENELCGYCPLDRTPLDSANINDLFPAPLIISNLIDDLKVYCLNQERGCDWTGSRWALERHVVIDCPRTGIKCNGTRHDGSKCELIAERQFFDVNAEVQQEKTNIGESEDSECIHKKFECEHCNQQITKITHKSHLENECLFNYTTCELCGNDMIPQKNLVKHQENCIKIGLLKCPAHELGCKWVGSNETSLEIHLANGNCQLYLLLPTYNTIQEKMTSLTSENEFLQQQINKILDSIIQGKITNLGYSESIEEINKFKSIEDQDKLIYLNFELDRLKYEINEKILPFMNKSRATEQENVMTGLINDTFMMREDMNVQRMMINSLRKQLQYLLFSRGRGTGIVSAVGAGMTGPFGFNNTPSEEGIAPEMYEIVSRSNSDERINLKL
ncbi:uncharacterized protein SPAPADRAFT_132142 [Spathaspora passalidarum NRRL Y-27907]|uniref:RING-type domain-containing protein n=1 Tax=Spathaspora passalidarum (strain NRRL Y-27907 / 11-Y1) TaxID=619300 RepID=G3AH64_SPAPN|nr:uncharacterized protein SPAPADRAFT_132142 [Spathaspora passalidarum NRRL Y-27907]EGW35494.1 hypothetical protein SPAPADRAFT_132142 [Spathaspora passalidarum NRRL Y-27907]